MTKSELQTQLAELLDERAQRTAAMEAATKAKAEAQARLSQLRASMVLDGGNLTKRIDAAQQEINAADVTLALWPDVQAELGRRIAAAQEAIKAAALDETRQELQRIMDKERGSRLEFANRLHDFAMAGSDLRAMLRRKQQLKMQLFEHGVVVEAGSDQLDAWPVFGIGEASTITAAQELLMKYGG